MLKTLRTWAVATALGVTLTSAGCEPPPNVQAVPPGGDLRESLMPKDDTAEARGETEPDTKTVVIPNLVPAPPTAKGEVKTTPSGITYETVKEGQGATVQAGQRVSVHYVGTLDDGRKFDSSRDRNQPSAFEIGTGKVIKGWDEAVPGMKVGEVRKMTVPPQAAYGAQGKGDIPPNATLHFEVEVMKIE